LQLADDLQGTIGAVQLASWQYMLPRLQKAFEIGRGHRLNLAPQLA